MEFIVEFVLDLLLEIGVEASKSSKVPKWVRILLIGVISLVFLCVIGLTLLLGVLVLENSVPGGIVIIGLGIGMLMAAVVKFRKTYLVKKRQISF